MTGSLTNRIFPIMDDSGCPDTWTCTRNGIEFTPAEFAQLLRWAAANRTDATDLADKLDSI